MVPPPGVKGRAIHQSRSTARRPMASRGAMPIANLAISTILRDLDGDRPGSPPTTRGPPPVDQPSVNRTAPLNPWLPSALNQNRLLDLANARQSIEASRIDHNSGRLHAAPGDATPQEFPWSHQGHLLV